jgi:hypothetical protein
MTDEVINEEVVEETPVEETETPEEEVAESSDETPEEPVEGEKPEATDEEVEQAVEMIKQLKLKVDGEEVIEELPFEVTPEQAEYLKKELQMSKMSQKRAQEAAELRKKDLHRDAQLEEFINTLKSNPDLILEQMGIDVNQFAEGVLAKEVEKMQMTPEERELAELREELAKIKEAEAKAKEEAELREQEVLRDKFAAEYEKNLIDSIEANGLPNSPHIINQLVSMVSEAHKNGLDLDFADVAPLVKEEYEADVRRRVSGLSTEDLLSILTEDSLSELVAKAMPEEKKEAPPTVEDIVDTGENVKKDEYARFRTESAEDFFRRSMLGK